MTSRTIKFLFFLLTPIVSICQLTHDHAEDDGNDFETILEEVHTSPCDCDVLLISSLIREELSQLPPQTTLVPVTLADAGNLDDFEGLNCTNKTIEVLTNRVNLRKDFRAKNLNQVLQLAERSDQVCLLGHFFFNETIDIPRGNMIRLLSNTIIEYVGDGDTPPILFDESFSTLVGDGNSNLLFSLVPTPEGFIQINSEDINAVRDNSISNVIRNINILSWTQTEGDPRNNRGIVLTNSPESLSLVVGPNGNLVQRSADRGSNYDAQISNVNIAGFDVGIHVEGFSNANLIRDINLNAIDAVGVWLSGSVDNSISFVTLTNSHNATAVRIDNYVDTVWDNTDDNTVNLNGILLNVPDPNCRFQITAADILNDIRNGAAFNADPSQGNFNALLNELHPYVLGLLVRRCAFANTVVNEPLPNTLTRFGLREFNLDVTANYSNYVNDNIEINDVIFDPTVPANVDTNTPFVDEINLFEDVMIAGTTIQSACSNEPIRSRNFLRPVTNILSFINVFDELGEQQVASGVEVWDRSDDLPLCEYDATGGLFVRNCNNPPPCDPDTRCDFGNSNKIKFCRPAGAVIRMDMFVINNTSIPTGTDACIMQIDEDNDVAIANQDPSITLPLGLSVRFH